MADTIALTTPLAQPSITGYTPGSLHLDLSPSARIVVTIIGTDGRGQVFEYPAAGTTTDTAAKTATLIGVLNTMNLSTRLAVAARLR